MRTIVHITMGLAVILAFDTPTRAIEKSQPDASKSNMHVAVQDFAQGVSFELHPDGKVDLAVTEMKDGKKTEKSYKANSIEEFKKSYPDVAEKYQIDRFMPRRFMEPLSQGTSPNEWENWKNWFERDWFWDNHQGQNLADRWTKQFPSAELKHWLDQQRQLFRDFRALPAPQEIASPETSSEGREFGIAYSPVSEALAEQLNLETAHAVMVMDVKPGSIADNAGIVRYDIIVKINGRPLKDRDQFRSEIHQLLGKNFTIELIRKGKHETIDVKHVA